ncbi:MAG TPA: Fe-S cluster assembly protein HesB [Bacteroidota bacterium]|nr:Fe-S cluster assembly protein HesB [Bacteroidota bacterium]
MKFSIDLPPGFRFRSVVLSHGWADLPPFSFDHRTESLHRPLLMGRRKIIHADFSQKGRSLVVNIPHEKSLETARRRELSDLVRAVFRIDQDMRPFYTAAARHREFAWIRRLGAGRLLRSPSVFEDTVKMICTTNCSWALTKILTRNLCDKLGAGTVARPGTGLRTGKPFPTPAAMASVSEKFYRTKIRAGYRSPYLLELATRVADGDLDIERWRDPGVAPEVIREEIASVKGVGPYAAGNILKLIGRYDELGIDSWCRKQFASIHRRGRPVRDSVIEKHYARFGEWKGLFFWMDLTKEWYEKSYAGIFES